MVLKATGPLSPTKRANSEPHELLAELFAELRDRALQPLDQGDPRLPAQARQTSQIQLFLRSAIGFAGVEEKSGSAAADGGMPMT